MILPLLRIYIRLTGYSPFIWFRYNVYKRFVMVVVANLNLELSITKDRCIAVEPSPYFEYKNPVF